MKNIKKIGLSALAGALAMTSAHAGAVSMTGSMEISYTNGGGYASNTGNSLGQENELSITAATELDNGVSVAYKQSITADNARNDSELVFGNILGGTLAMQSTGSPLDGIDNKTPTAFKDAEGMTGSINDVSGANGDFGIRYTLSDVAGTGIKLDYNYVPKHGTGDAAGDEAASGGGEGNEDAHDITITGSVPGVDGLNLGAGYAVRNYDTKAATGVNASEEERHDATAYATYAYGPLTFGAQIGAVGKAGSGGAQYKNKYAGVSYAVSDDLSLSYNWAESYQLGTNNTLGIVQDWSSISLSYSMGGMTININDSDCGNCKYTASKKTDARTVSMSIAF